MKVLLSILSISMLSTIWLGPSIAGGAQLLSDDELDQVTAAGPEWSVELFQPSNIPSNIAVGTNPTNSAVPSSPLGSALTSVSAAEASALAGQAIGGHAGLSAASTAVATAAIALTDASAFSGLASLNAGRASLTAAGEMLNSVPFEEHTPAITDAIQRVNQAATSLNQAALNTKAIELNSAVKAIEAAKIAINALPGIAGESDHGQAIDAAVNSIQIAKGAINAAFEAQAASAGGSQTLVLTENLQPLLRIHFKSGAARGAIDVSPLVTRGGASQPGLDALNLDGAAISGPNGLLPLSVIAETLMLNINLCYLCQADKIIQNNNGYVIPIYAR
ncbi:MAG: hypothetical protein JSU59_02195 [Nitrospirota bacterium]|nr:MAG: hypothetical protein JSU59_02195 [Nitrospirota bacterium]